MKTYRILQIFVITILILSNNYIFAQTVDVATSPLEKAAKTPPNVMFIYDDSGSMKWSLLPDELDGLIVDRVKRLVLECTGNGRNRVCRYVEETSARNYLFGATCNHELFNTNSTETLDGVSYQRCLISNSFFIANPVFNELYFDINKASSYTLPLKPDGKPYYVPKFGSSRLNGFDPNSQEINLSSDYNIINGYHDSSRRVVVSLGDTSQKFNKESAYYFEYTCPLIGKEGYIKQATCFQKRTIVSEEHKQAFANWFSFYRTRELLAKSSIMQGFMKLPSDYRFGYFSINKRSDTDISKLDKYSSKQNGFFTWLANAPSVGSTPLREALYAAGNYFSSKEPWRDIPHDGVSAVTACRRSISILMTDGYWNIPNELPREIVGEQDNQDGPVIPGAEAASYKAVAPFADAQSNTLADVAMKFWKNDLLPDVPNRVEPVPPTDPSLPTNPATWQHMTTYGIGLGVKGSIEDPLVALRSVNTKQAVSWANVDTNPGKIDDLLHATVNSYGRYYSAKNVDEFKKGLENIVKELEQSTGSNTSLGATSLNSLTKDNTVYQASYTPGFWSGDLQAFDADVVTNGILKSKWKASEKLPNFNARKILYRSPAKKAVVAFTPANIAAEAESFRALFGNSADLANRIRFLQGDRTNEYSEQNQNALFRKRSSVLGDIVNSNPVLVGEPTDMNYQRYSWGSGYRDFLNNNQKRKEVIYTSANDGMLHAFDAATGVELFAYLPSSMFEKQPDKQFNPLFYYSDRSFSHRFLLDASSVVADIQINGVWKTILVGGAGRAGNNIFALDITNPDAPELLWDKLDTDVGLQIGKPQIFRSETGEWFLAYGSGYNNAKQSSALVLINLTTGVSKVMSTGVGNNSSASDVALIDANNNGNADYAYMGDSLGNVWKFDLTDASNSQNWNIAFSGKPLFTAKIGNVAQPISAGLQARINPADGYVWLFFGTGRYVTLSDPRNNSVQSMYGIKDGATIISGGRSDLTQRIITDVDSGNRRVFPKDTLPLENRGWYFDLVATGERIVDTPQFFGSEIVVNTRIPDGDNCRPKGSGFVMMFNPFTGTRLPRHLFDFNDDGVFDAGDGVNGDEVSGFKTETQNSITTVVRGTKTQLSTVITRDIQPQKIGLNVGLDLGRQSWYEVMR